MKKIFKTLGKVIVFVLVISLLNALARDGLRNGSYDMAFKDPNSSYIAVFAYPSAAYLDWSSPSALTKTTVKSQLAKEFLRRPSGIGHAQFAWQCRLPNGKVLAGASGQSGQDNGQGVSGVLGGWGLSLLELVYTDGHIERRKDVENRVIRGVNSHQFSWVGFKVPLENCLYLAKYVKDYIDKKAYQNYGFPVEPLKFQGGGCTSYTHAALMKSKLNIPIMEEWTRDYKIPKKYMGRTKELPVKSIIVPQAKIPESYNTVKLTEFLLTEVTWADTGEAFVPFKYYDPELFYESFIHMENIYRSRQDMPTKPPTRTDVYDAFQTDNKKATEQWVRSLLDAQHGAEIQEIYGVSGLVLDLRKSS